MTCVERRADGKQPVSIGIQFGNAAASRWFDYVESVRGGAKLDRITNDQ
jgi:hypothetical protein